MPERATPAAAVGRHSGTLGQPRALFPEGSRLRLKSEKSARGVDAASPASRRTSLIHRRRHRAPAAPRRVHRTRWNLARGRSRALPIWVRGFRERVESGTPTAQDRTMSWARAFDWDGHGYGCASYAAAKVDSLRRSTSKRSDRVRLRAFDPVLAVHDLDQSAAWFCRVLGCERSDPDPGNWAFCAAGAVTFMLGRCPEALPASSLGDHTYVAYFESR